MVCKGLGVKVKARVINLRLISDLPDLRALDIAVGVQPLTVGFSVVNEDLSYED